MKAQKSTIDPVVMMCLLVTLIVMLAALSTAVFSGCGPSPEQDDAGTQIQSTTDAGYRELPPGSGFGFESGVQSPNNPTSVCVGVDCLEIVPLTKSQEVTDPVVQERRAMDDKLPYVRPVPVLLEETKK